MMVGGKQGLQAGGEALRMIPIQGCKGGKDCLTPEGGCAKYERNEVWAVDIEFDSGVQKRTGEGTGAEGSTFGKWYQSQAPYRSRVGRDSHAFEF
jgi:hypothetical protein